MASKVTICNLALARIGDEANIASIDPPEGSAMAEVCQRLYPLAVEVVLEAHDWTFAMMRRALAKLSSVETGGWKFGFKVPSDALRVVAVRDQKFQSGRHAPVPLAAWGDLGTTVRFELVSDGAQRVLLCDVETPVVDFVSGETGEALFSPGFADALAWYLASALAGQRIKGEEGQKLVQYLSAQYRISLGQAKMQDARQQKNRIEFVPAWLRTR